MFFLFFPVTPLFLPNRFLKSFFLSLFGYFSSNYNNHGKNFITIFFFYLYYIYRKNPFDQWNSRLFFEKLAKNFPRDEKKILLFRIELQIFPRREKRHFLSEKFEFSEENIFFSRFQKRGKIFSKKENRSKYIVVFFRKKNIAHGL